MKNKLSLQEEIYSEERKEKNTVVLIMILFLSIAGIAVVWFQHEYVKNHRAELEAKVQMYK